jgi:hypothetical protein
MVDGEKAPEGQPVEEATLEQADLGMGGLGEEP